MRMVTIIGTIQPYTEKRHEKNIYWKGRGQSMYLKIM